MYRPTSGDVVVDGKPVSFASPREALDAAIATVFQDLAMIPLLSITRNFFMGREPVKKIGPLAFIDMAFADKVAAARCERLGSMCAYRNRRLARSLAVSDNAWRLLVQSTSVPRC